MVTVTTTVDSNKPSSDCSILCPMELTLIQVTEGLTVTDGHENVGPLKFHYVKLQGIKLQDMKMQDMYYDHKNVRF